ncbi:hypothetical protein LNI90_00830 [Tenacibaculum dicentrarchi]|nr:hypothetical protein [Tenacibaculum dicentrarchi]MCD8415432.1 hypothetical protein [Tenacibaculum dicentrarchi]MCD8420466.1 hypothetical protein [Tenacibaculum dicentrarchi]MCD8423826.1 hypothetical protein [Tenacibaculum dicentrarchi]MCD8436842.1 hypothetical protein [Tenacibaculum dicentrarchi]
MKNLNDFGVQELSGKEIKETQGGYWWLIGVGLAVLNTDWDKAGEDFSNGYNA